MMAASLKGAKLAKDDEAELDFMLMVKNRRGRKGRRDGAGTDVHDVIAGAHVLKLMEHGMRYEDALPYVANLFKMSEGTVKERFTRYNLLFGRGDTPRNVGIVGNHQQNGDDNDRPKHSTRRSRRASKF
jgi:hypothetical protein